MSTAKQQIAAATYIEEGDSAGSAIERADRTVADRTLELVRKAGIVRARDLTAHGLSPTHLQRLYEQGLLLRSGRGIYMLADPVTGSALDENAGLVEVTLRAPSAIICLLSALQFHGLTSQAPHEVWIALPARVHRPAIDYPPTRVITVSGAALTEGVETHRISGVSVRIYSPAKTVADCFRFRSRIGLDVAIEALKDCWHKRRATVDELWRSAQADRVDRVMRPYLEAIAA